MTSTGSRKSATGGSLNARWPFSPIPAQTMSAGSASSRSSYSRQVRSGRSARSPGIRRSRSAIEADEPEQVLLKVAAERGGVVGGQPQVLVHVEADDPRPVDLLAGHQPREELVLARRRGEDHVRLAGRLLAVVDRLADGLGRRPAGLAPVLVDLNLKRIDGETGDRPRLGKASWAEPGGSGHRSIRGGGQAVSTMGHRET